MRDFRSWLKPAPPHGLPVTADTIVALAKEHGVAVDEVLNALGHDPEHAKRDARATNERIAKAADELKRERFFRELREREGATPAERLQKAEAAVDEAAEKIRASDPTLSYEQAFEKACEIEPRLYTAVRKAAQEAADFTIAAGAEETRRMRRDDMHEKVERAAVAIRKADPSLTAEQAYVRVLDDLHPDLYV